MRPDAPVVAMQLGRPPRGRWRVVVRCAHDRPSVISVAPLLEDGVPFPTTFWLTCPHLVEAVSQLESAGETAAWTDRIAGDDALIAAMSAADAAYRIARAAEGDGADPLPGVGVAGQADPLVVKCLHARLAACLAGVADPIGTAVLDGLGESGAGTACRDDRCGRAL
jgi:uncharacterized protein